MDRWIDRCMDRWIYMYIYTYIYIYICIYIYIYIGGWGERVLASPPRPGNRFVSFVRACVRPTRGFPILCRSSSKSVTPPQYLLSFVPPGFLFVRGGGPSCSNLDFSPWLVSFIFGDLIFYLWSSSREFLKRVREESSWREFPKRVFEGEFLKNVLG